MRNLIRIGMVLVVVCLTCLFVVSCGESDVKKIAICTPYMSSVTTKEMVDTMEDRLLAEGFEVSVMDSANDVSKFAADIETSVISGSDAIIIVSAAPSLVEPQIKEASASNVLVFGCDSGYIDEMQMNSTSDNFQMGEQISTYLFDKMGKEGTVVHLSHRPHPGVVQRTLAMEEVLKRYPEVVLLSEHHVDVPNQINNAKEIMENLLTAYPAVGSIDAVLCGWDEPAIGVTQALQEAGRDEILVVGVDGNEQAVTLIDANTNLVATLKQDFEGMAGVVVEDVIKSLEGESVSKGNKFVPALLVE